MTLSVTYDAGSRRGRDLGFQRVDGGPHEMCAFIDERDIKHLFEKERGASTLLWSK